MQVVLAEKPSVAGEIAAVLGAKIKMDPTTKGRMPLVCQFGQPACAHQLHGHTKMVKNLN